MTLFGTKLQEDYWVFDDTFKDISYDSRTLLATASVGTVQVVNQWSIQQGGSRPTVFVGKPQPTVSSMYIPPAYANAYASKDMQAK